MQSPPLTACLVQFGALHLGLVPPCATQSPPFCACFVQPSYLHLVCVPVPPCAMHNPPFCAFFGQPDALHREWTFVPPCATQNPPLCACLGHPPGYLHRLFSFILDFNPLDPFGCSQRLLHLITRSLPATQEKNDEKTTGAERPTLVRCSSANQDTCSSITRALLQIYRPGNAGNALLWGGRTVCVWEEKEGACL
jgi:hypothetical protein